jgi:Flp pilus assembly protein TadG
MRRLRSFFGNRDASAAAELALVMPFLLTLIVGSMELGKFFLDEHALAKQVRDGARFASRLQISDDYSCPDQVYADAGATDQIVKVTKDGVVSGAGKPRWAASYWDRTCDGGGDTVTVTLTCVAKDQIDTDDSGHTGLYSGLDGSIPVVTVAGAVKYRSVMAQLGFNVANLCMRAESQAAVQGI